MYAGCLLLTLQALQSTKPGTKKSHRWCYIGFKAAVLSSTIQLAAYSASLLGATANPAVALQGNAAASNLHCLVRLPPAAVVAVAPHRTIAWCCCWRWWLPHRHHDGWPHPIGPHTTHDWPRLGLRHHGPGRRHYIWVKAAIM